MGNTQTSSNLKTAAIARYMSLSKHQVVQLHDACQQLSKPFNRTTFKRKHFTAALNQAQIDNETDRDILSCLCTMWDLSGDGYVPFHEFNISLTSLACPGEPISSVLGFAFQLMDQTGSGEVSAKQVIILLKSLNATASYFGDNIMTLRQIYKTVDSVFETMSVVDDNGETLTHQEAISRLIRKDVIKRTFHRESMLNVDQEDSSNNNSLLASSNDEKSVSLRSSSARRREKGSGAPFVKTRLQDDASRGTFTDVSSVMLSPLVEVTVNSFENSTFTKTTSSAV